MAKRVENCGRTWRECPFIGGREKLDEMERRMLDKSWVWESSCGRCYVRRSICIRWVASGKFFRYRPTECQYEKTVKTTTVAILMFGSEQEMRRIWMKSQIGRRKDGTKTGRYTGIVWKRYSSSIRWIRYGRDSEVF